VIAFFSLSTVIFSVWLYFGSALNLVLSEGNLVLSDTLASVNGLIQLSFNLSASLCHSQTH